MHRHQHRKVLVELMSATRPLQRLQIKGFTLIELLITLAILGVLAALAVPSYRSFIINQQVSAASSDMLFSLLQARSEAMRLGKLVAVVPVDPADSTQAGTDWANGWFLAEVDNNCALTGTPFGKASEIPSTVAIKSSTTSKSFAASNPSFAYSPAGFPYTTCASPFYSGAMNGTIVFVAAETARERWVIVSKTGRARICDPTRESCSSD